MHDKGTFSSTYQKMIVSLPTVRGGTEREKDVDQMIRKWRVEEGELSKIFIFHLRSKRPRHGTHTPRLWFCVSVVNPQHGSRSCENPVAHSQTIANFFVSVIKFKLIFSVLLLPNRGWEKKRRRNGGKNEKKKEKTSLWIITVIIGLFHTTRYVTSRTTSADI